jgi:hypothetical protein
VKTYQPCWFLQITYQSTYDLSTANNVYYWVDGYRLINRCNLVIEGVTNAITKGIVTSVGDNYWASKIFKSNYTFRIACSF